MEEFEENPPIVPSTSFSTKLNVISAEVISLGFCALTIVRTLKIKIDATSDFIFILD